MCFGCCGTTSSSSSSSTSPWPSSTGSGSLTTRLSESPLSYFASIQAGKTLILKTTIRQWDDFTAQGHCTKGNLSIANPTQHCPCKEGRQSTEVAFAVHIQPFRVRFICQLVKNQAQLSFSQNPPFSISPDQCVQNKKTHALSLTMS